jgi:hypothetical protein
VVLLAEGLDHAEGLAQRLAAGKRALAGAWMPGPSAIGIGERHAEFDDVGAGGGQCVEDLLGVSRSGSPAMTKVDERRTVLGPH